MLGLSNNSRNVRKGGLKWGISYIHNCDGGMGRLDRPI